MNYFMPINWITQKKWKSSQKHITYQDPQKSKQIIINKDFEKMGDNSLDIGQGDDFFFFWTTANQSAFAKEISNKMKHNLPNGRKFCYMQNICKSHI